MEAEAGLKAGFEYSTDLFEPGTIKRMAAHYQRLLEAIIDDVSQPIATLPMLTAAEREQLLIAPLANQTAHSFALCAHQLIEKRALRSPDAIAVSYEDRLHRSTEGGDGNAAGHA